MTKKSGEKVEYRSSSK